MFLGCLPCCDGGSEQPCGCGPQEQVRPESLTIEFAGFTFAPAAEATQFVGYGTDTVSQSGYPGKVGASLVIRAVFA